MQQVAGRAGAGQHRAMYSAATLMTYQAPAIILNLPFLQANLVKPPPVADCGAYSLCSLSSPSCPFSLWAACLLLGNDVLSNGEAGCPEGCAGCAGSSAGNVGYRVADAGIQGHLLCVGQGLEGGRPRGSTPRCSCPLKLLQRQHSSRLVATI